MLLPRGRGQIIAGAWWVAYTTIGQQYRNTIDIERRSTADVPPALRGQAMHMITVCSAMFNVVIVSELSFPDIYLAEKALRAGIPK